MAFGRGRVNHPVKDLETGKVEITGQNHGFRVSPQSRAGQPRRHVVETHVSLFDRQRGAGSRREKPVFACEFDYSGAQACKALKEEGYRVVLVNSNPATIMTDPELADATYIEPITPEVVAKIIEKERPTRCCRPWAGRPALNTGLALDEMGVLEKFGVEMIGAKADVIDKAEDRLLFREAMDKIGLESRPRRQSGRTRPWKRPARLLDDVGLPAIIRPSFTLGGTGGGIAYNREEFEEIVAGGLDASPGPPRC